MYSVKPLESRAVVFLPYNLGKCNHHRTLPQYERKDAQFFMLTILLTTAHTSGPMLIITRKKSIPIVTQCV